MAEKPKEIILKSPKPHTLIKHHILKKYLKEWFPILGRQKSFPRVIYIDGFAGPGIYEDGSPGSPIIAIQTAITHLQTLHASVDFTFIEFKQDRFKVLKEQVNIAKQPIVASDKNEKFKFNTLCGSFSDIMPKIVEEYDTPKNGGFNAAFVFIDPFGYAGIPLKLIGEIMRHRSCEVLITFMYEEINRFMADSGSDNARDELFGTVKWRECSQKLDKRERLNCLYDLYQSQLSQVANIKYIRSFAMLTGNDKFDYFLFFGTNKPEGLRVMKSAMWSANQSGSYSFSDRTKPGQEVMFDEPDYELLKKLLREQFTGKIVPIEKVKKFVLEETPFRDDKDLKKHALEPMVKSLEVIRYDQFNKVKKGTGFPPGTYIKFQKPEGLQPPLF